MRYNVRKPYRYGNRIYMPGEKMPVTGDDVKVLQGRGIIGAPATETASVKPPERAVIPKAGPNAFGNFVRKVTAEPKHLGGGWYELPDGRKVRKKDLEEVD